MQAYADTGAITIDPNALKGIVRLKGMPPKESAAAARAAHPERSSKG